MGKNGSSILNQDSLLFFYQLTSDEIHHAQKQKWSITCYSLLINAAIFGVFKLLDAASIRLYEELALITLAVIVLFAGVLYLVFTHKLLVEYQLRLRRIYKNLPEDKYIILEKPALNAASIPSQLANLVVPYVLVLFVECVAVIYLVIR
jgi:uncharacterized membrane protein